MEMMTTMKRRRVILTPHSDSQVNLVDLIPQDIMIEILLRLSIESIVSFKLVSKKWMNIINDPKFYKDYANQTKNRTAFFLGLNRLFCVSMRHDDGISNPNPNPNPPLFAVHIIPLDWQEVVDSFPFCNELLDCGWSNSNGLVCVKSTNHHFLLRNPITGAVFTVKDSPMQECPFSWLCYGFGYDPEADDYTILVVCDYLKRGPKGTKNLGKKLIKGFQNKDNDLFWVYSLGNKRWKRCRGFPAGAYDWSTYFQIGARACCINGVLHWLVVRRANLKDVIVTYNLHTGRFGEFSSSGPDNAFDLGLQVDATCPDYIQSEGRMCHTRKLAELNGHLCYISKAEWKSGTHYTYPVRYDLWVMNHYGLGDSWEKLASIDPPKFKHEMVIGSFSTGQFKPWYWDCVTPALLYQAQDGNKLVLFVCNYYKRLFWYDVADKKITFVNKRTWHRREWTQSIDRRFNF